MKFDEGRSHSIIYGRPEGLPPKAKFEQGGLYFDAAGNLCTGQNPENFKKPGVIKEPPKRLANVWDQPQDEEKPEIIEGLDELDVFLAVGHTDVELRRFGREELGVRLLKDVTPEEVPALLRAIYIARKLHLMDMGE